MSVENILHHQRIEDKKILENFSDTLSKLGFEHDICYLIKNLKKD